MPKEEKSLDELYRKREEYHLKHDYASEDKITVTIMNEKAAQYFNSKHYLKWIAFKIVNLISSYGTNPFRVLFVMGFSLLASFCVYLLMNYFGSFNKTLVDLVEFTLLSFISPQRGCNICWTIISFCEAVWGLLLIPFLSFIVIKRATR